MPLPRLLGLAWWLAVAAADWQPGRATWFDVHNNDLTTANCHFRWDQISTGRYIAALSDRNPMFASSCGLCMEVRCQNTRFTDGLGESLDRTNACRAGGRSIVVTVCDACPCSYPQNGHSNARWCCADDPNRRHLDISREAFSQLADLSIGVIGLEWRLVDCNTRAPVSTAALPSLAVQGGSVAERMSTATAMASASAGGLPVGIPSQKVSAEALKQSVEQRMAEARARAESLLNSRP